MKVNRYLVAGWMRLMRDNKARAGLRRTIARQLQASLLLHNRFSAAEPSHHQLGTYHAPLCVASVPQFTSHNLEIRLDYLSTPAWLWRKLSLDRAHHLSLSLIGSIASQQADDNTL